MKARGGPHDSCCLAAAFLLLVACNVESRAPDSEGAGGGDGGACANGITVVLSDFLSTLVTLGRLDGTTQSAAFLSTGSSGTDGLSFALSGDVVLPSSRAASGRVVLVDRFGTNVVTWADPGTAKVVGQLPIGTGFESNPSDYLEFESGEAFVTRWGENSDPGKQAYDRGGDILVLDSERFEITGSIELPRSDDLPPRPSSMVQMGDVVLVALERIARDFSLTGEAELAGISASTHELSFLLRYSGLKGCGRPALSPSGELLAVACSGALTRTGNVTNLSESALVLLDAKSSPPLELRRLPAAALAGAPLQSSAVFASEKLVLLKTQSEIEGSDSNRWLALNLESDEVQTLLEAGTDARGKGKGIVYGGMLCAPECSNVCLLADADRGVLQRARIGNDRAELLSPIRVETKIGLPPRDLTLR